VKVTVQGLKELDKALGELRTKAIAKGVVRRALLEAARPMQERAEALAPVRTDPSDVVTYRVGASKDSARRVRRIGTMRALVVLTTALTSRQASQARRDDKHFSSVYVGTRDPIARLQEYGTAQHPAQPFMRPAFDAEGMPTVNRFIEAMWGEISKAAAREARRTARLSKG